MSDKVVMILFITVPFIVLLFLPIVFKVAVGFNGKQNIADCEIKLFYFVKVFKVEIDVNNQKLRFILPKEKEFDFSQLDFKKPVRLWLVKAIKGIVADLIVDVDIFEFSRRPNLTVSLLGLATVFGTVLKALFNKSKTNINVNDHNTNIELKARFFTSIFLFLTAFIKHVSKGAKNANSKLFSKSDRADSRVGNI